MSRLQNQSSPLYVPGRTDPTASEAFVDEAMRTVGGALSRHTLATLPSRFELDEQETLAWLSVALTAKNGPVWDRTGLDEMVAVVHGYASQEVAPDYVRTLSSRYDFLSDSLTITQLRVYGLPAEWASVASLRPWTVYALRTMFDAGMPAEYTAAWETWSKNINDYWLVQLYKAGASHEYALSLISLTAPDHIVSLHQADVPLQYARAVLSARSLPAEDIILLHQSITAEEAVPHLKSGLTAAAAVLVVTEGVPVEYARAIS